MSIQKALYECSIRWPLSAPSNITKGQCPGCNRPIAPIRSRAEWEDAAPCGGKFLRGRSGTEPYLRHTTGLQTYAGGNTGHRVQAPGFARKKAIPNFQRDVCPRMQTLL